MNKAIKSIQKRYYLINISYMSSLAIFGAVFYIYLQEQGFSFLEINLFGSVFWVVNFLTELPAGVFSDKYGRKASMILSSFIRGIGLFLLLFSYSNVKLLLFSSALTAIGESLKSGTLEAWALDKISLIDDDFDSTLLFSKDKLYLSSTNLIITFVGAQILAQINLNIPFILAPIMLFFNIMVVLFLMDNDFKTNSNMMSDEATNQNLLSSLTFGFKLFKSSPYLLNLVLALLPIQIILSGPASQWQLFFSEQAQTIITGYISILITLCAMLGHYLTPKISSHLKNKLSFFILTTVLNAGAIILTAMSPTLFTSILFFSLHIIAMASEQVYRYSILNNEIKTQDRATVLSTFNTIESGFTVVCFLLVGFLADKFSLSTSWIICAILLLLSALPMFVSLIKKTNISSVDYE